MQCDTKVEQYFGSTICLLSVPFHMTSQKRLKL